MKQTLISALILGVVSVPAQATDTFDTTTHVLTIPSLTMTTPLGSTNRTNVQIMLGADGAWKVLSAGDETPAPTTVPTTACTPGSNYSTSLGVPLSLTLGNSGYSGSIYKFVVSDGSLTGSTLTAKLTMSEGTTSEVRELQVTFSADCKTFSGQISKTGLSPLPLTGTRT